MAMAGVVETVLDRLSGGGSLGKAATALEDVLAMDHLARTRAAERRAAA
jgi:1-deoxy-D-xylulose-5-phosphate reductoisomerase